MFQIIDNNIKITAGDDATIKVDLRDNDGHLVPIDGTLTFTVKQTITSEVLITRITTEPTFYLLGSDTQDLSGIYVYSLTYTKDDAQYTVADGFMTVIGDICNG